MEKLFTSKRFSKMAGGRICIPLILPLLDPPLAISYKNHQKSLACFSCLAPLLLLWFTKRQSQMGGGGHGTMPTSLNTLLRALHVFRDMIIIRKESTIAFRAIDKLVAFFFKFGESLTKKRFYVSRLLSESQAKSNGL